ncbi:hypothetical protein PROFUN_14486 [Planoprotostelium fungivorum]|uniref:Uncharacterized protein n=1 Tax=Planoprotostelium fungivorum TaxID=1890364 RepID=A0A2P6N011_9EUKA|nr:hypothetical protein PROFUN_14486 [Planoprotostelium fungivorum]
MNTPTDEASLFTSVLGVLALYDPFMLVTLDQALYLDIVLSCFPFLRRLQDLEDINWRLFLYRKLRSRQPLIGGTDATENDELIKAKEFLTDHPGSDRRDLFYFFLEGTTFDKVIATEHRDPMRSKIYTLETSGTTLGVNGETIRWMYFSYEKHMSLSIGEDNEIILLWPYKPRSNNVNIANAITDAHHRADDADYTFKKGYRDCGHYRQNILDMLSIIYGVPLLMWDQKEESLQIHRLRERAGLQYNPLIDTSFFDVHRSGHLFV